MPSRTEKFTSTSPLHLTAVGVVSRGGGGVNAIALKNPLGQPMEILEIKWDLWADTSTVVPVVSLGASVNCKLDLGKYPITNGAVPVWNFGRSENLQNEIALVEVPPCVCTYNWRLPRPLYIPAGAVLSPVFEHTGLIDQDINVRISYSCRNIDPRQAPPKRVSLPYVSSWTSDSFSGAEAGTDSSDETELVNIFSEPLRIQRFVGRLVCFFNDADPFFSEGIATLASPGFSNVVANDKWFIRMRDSNGNQIVRSYTPFRMIFDELTRAWDLENGAVMDPGSFIIADLRKDSASASEVDAGVVSCQSMISVVGWHDVVGGDRG